MKSFLNWMTGKKDSPEEKEIKSDEWPDLWKTQHKKGFVYHPDFDYYPNKSDKILGNFTVGYDGEIFKLISPYIGYDKSLKGIILSFFVSMPGFILAELPKIVLAKGKPLELTDLFGVSNNDFIVRDPSKGFHNHIEDYPENWYFIELERSYFYYTDLVKIISKHWEDVGVPFKSPMPDYKNPEILDEIKDVVYGSTSGINQRYKFSYPDPDLI